MKRTPGRTNITRERFRELTRPLVGMPVSHAWRGFGSAIFLELGELTTCTRTYRTRGEVAHIDGEAKLMLEWSWRVERPGSIEFGSWSTNPRINRGVESLRGHTILEVELEGRLPELVLTLDGKRWLHTFMSRGPAAVVHPPARRRVAGHSPRPPVPPGAAVRVGERRRLRRVMLGRDESEAPAGANEFAAGNSQSPPARTRRPGRVRRPGHRRVRYL